MLLLGGSQLSCSLVPLPPERPDVPPPALPPPPPPPPNLEQRFERIAAELGPPSDDGLTTAVAIEGSTANFSRLRRALDAIVREDMEDYTAEHGPLVREGRVEREGPPPQARIAMFGSSHIAGDLVSGALRERLQRQFGDAGHGFVTAVPPYGDYWQSGVHVEEGEGWSVVEASAKFLDGAIFGPNGMAFDALEPAWAELTAERASHVELFYLSQPGGGTLEVSVDGVAHELDTRGALPSGAVEHIALLDGPHRVRLETDGSEAVRIFGAAFERDVRGVLVDQLGLNGTTAAHVVQNDETVQRTLLSSRRADLFVMWLGTNEASEDWPIEVQAERFRAAIARLGSSMPGAGCLVVGPLDRRQHDRDGHPFVPWALTPIAAMQHRIALEEGCAYYDALAWQSGEGPLVAGPNTAEERERSIGTVVEGPVERFEAASPPLMRPDRVHLTYEGYVRFSADFVRALLEVLARTEP